MALHIAVTFSETCTTGTAGSPGLMASTTRDTSMKTSGWGKGWRKGGRGEGGGGGEGGGRSGGRGKNGRMGGEW